MTKQADLKRRVRARMAKTGESYTAARAQVLAVREPGTVHVTNGDSTASTLREGGVVPRIVVWRDVLHEGPVPAVGDDELRGVRARFLAGDDAAAVARVRRLLAKRDLALEAGRDGRYVLWFEADLYDQLQVAQILDRLARLDVAPERITLISIGEHLGIARPRGARAPAPAQAPPPPPRAPPAPP